MKAMQIFSLGPVEPGSQPLKPVQSPQPAPTDDEILIQVTVCGVCHTELDEIEGRTAPPRLPVTPGHQVVGVVMAIGKAVTTFQINDRVGVAWLFDTCGDCEYCRNGQENLCPNFKATGRDANGGYAEYMTVPANSAYHIPDIFSDTEAAPLLCAGAIGYRSFKLSNHQPGQRLGLTGFGASAHLVLLLVKGKYPQSEVYVFARNPQERAFALKLGAVWAGDISDTAPLPLHAIIDTTPAWKPVVEGLRNLAPGGRLVINAIRKEATDRDYLLNLDYATHLWQEKEIKSVANITRADVREFLALAAEIGLTPTTQSYTLDQANNALISLRTKKIRGGKVLKITPYNANLP